MIVEKKKILAHRLIWTILAVAVIVIPIALLYSYDADIVLVDSECYTDYYSYLDESSCEVYLYFNKEVTSGYVEVAFYDKNDNLLKVAKEYVFIEDYANSGYCGKATIFDIPGNVKYYEILSFRMNEWMYPSSYYTIRIVAALLHIPIFAFCICSWFLSCKIYYYNEQTIIVFAGMYQHYMKLGGVIVDEHNTTRSRTPIMLSCLLPDGTSIAATISRTNRVVLKINGQLYTKTY